MSVVPITHQNPITNQIAVTYPIASAVASASWRTAKTTLTPAQVNALNSTSITVVPAQGTSNIIFKGARVHKAAGTAYGGVAAGENLEFRLNNGSGKKVGEMETTGMLDTADEEYRVVRQYSAGTSADSAYTLSPGDPIIVRSTGGFTGGAGESLEITVSYLVVE